MDFESAFEIALKEIDQRYQTGVISYIKVNYPSLWKRFRQAEESISITWLSNEQEAFMIHLNTFISLAFQGIRLFKIRGTQRDLFDGGKR
jgi:hypothetical protein